MPSLVNCEVVGSDGGVDGCSILISSPTELAPSSVSLQQTKKTYSKEFKFDIVLNYTLQVV